ncbi:MAG: hypothetical protein ACMXYC_00830 [Candidatus Woesearchaeota archaeon]
MHEDGDEKMKVIVPIMGRPGSGKDTLAHRFAEDYIPNNVQVIGTGDMIRGKLNEVLGDMERELASLSVPSKVGVTASELMYGSDEPLYGNHAQSSAWIKTARFMQSGGQLKTETLVPFVNDTLKSVDGIVLASGWLRTRGQFEELLLKQAQSTGYQVTDPIEIKVSSDEAKTRILRGSRGRADDNPEAIDTRNEFYDRALHTLLNELNAYTNPQTEKPYIMRSIDGHGTPDEVYARFNRVVLGVLRPYLP